ncbi:MAG: family efflux transporter [Rhodospirillales bacterium]|nr:family efflux transporter [Rhodospirillales bacterium]
MNHLHRRILGLAIPIALANLTQPLLSAVDTAIAGHLPGPAYLGGVALGSLFFNFVFWGFGFLRMATTGLVAQAHGAADWPELRAVVARSAILAVGIGVALLLVQRPLAQLAIALLGGSAEVQGNALSYSLARIWSAPAALLNYVVLGTLLGRQHAGLALLLQLLINAANAGAAFLFVYGFGWGIAGLGGATALADWIGLAFGAALLWRLRTPRSPPLVWRALLDPIAMSRLVRVNRDIFIRTLCLLSAFAWFAHLGAGEGDVILATNAILLNFQAFMSYTLDGFANAVETLAGAALGAGDRKGLKSAIRVSTIWAASVAALFSLIYFLLGPAIIGTLTDQAAVRGAALTYLPWAALSPIVSVWGFQLDGVFIGCTRTRELRDAMMISVAVFFILEVLFEHLWGNHGLWIGFLLFMLLRAGSLGFWLRVNPLLPDWPSGARRPAPS